MDVRIEKSWKSALVPEFEKEYFGRLVTGVRNAYSSRTVYPPASKIFAAFDYCPLDTLSVVILGQDPYHGPGQANGLAFSVSEGVALPPSLKNIFKEVDAEFTTGLITDGNLERWARQGVLLLNAALTVEAHTPMSHQKIGWLQFTDAVIKTVSERCDNVVFMLWGNFAISKAALIDASKHLVLKSVHPSPLSANRGFFGCGHFEAANRYLESKGKNIIDWK